MKTTEAVNDNFYLPIGRKFITPILPTSFKQQFSVKTANGLQFLAVVFFILATVNYIFGIFLADFISGIVIYSKRNDVKQPSESIKPFKNDELNDVELPLPKRPFMPSEGNNDDKPIDKPAEMKPKRTKKRSAKTEAAVVTFELDGQTYNGTFDPDGNILYTDENGQIQQLNKTDFETETA